MGLSDTCQVCDSEKEDVWIQCDVCGLWYHGECVGLSPGEIDQILAYHCKKCFAKAGESEYRRKLKRSRVKIDYVALNDGEVFAVDKSMHPHVHKFHDFPVEVDRKFGGPVDVRSQLQFDEVVQSHLPRPILVPEADVGMKLPVDRDKLTIDYILDKVGGDTPVEVMDVLSQQGVSPRWNMQQWRDYFVTAVDGRDRIRNVISLEISQVDGLGKTFTRPKMVEEIDLIDKIWTDDERPQVTKYCLMSVAGSFTDFHIDFGGTSVYYTVCSGSKTFLMFPPTPSNLQLYTSWCLEPNQNFMWFPEYLKPVKGKRTVASDGFKVTLKPGDVFIIPSGWIHAVYTPADSIVIGGNYLTMMNMQTQLDIYNIEKTTHVPMKFRHPQFNKVLWLASWYYMNHEDEYKADTGTKIKQEVEDNGLKALADHLDEHYTLSKTNQTARKSIPINLIGKDVPQYIDDFRKWIDNLY